MIYTPIFAARWNSWFVFFQKPGAHLRMLGMNAAMVLLSFVYCAVVGVRDWEEVACLLGNIQIFSNIDYGIPISWLIHVNVIPKTRLSERDIRGDRRGWSADLSVELHVQERVSACFIRTLHPCTHRRRGHSGGHHCCHRQYARPVRQIHGVLPTLHTLKVISMKVEQTTLLLRTFVLGPDGRSM